MGLFDKIKSAIGIGQPKLELILVSHQIKRGESIKGCIFIKSGSTDIPLKMINIEHVEIFSGRQWNGSQKKMVNRTIRSTVNKLTLSGNGEILSPGSRWIEEFELPVSSMAMNSGHPYSHELKVSMDVPGIDPSKSVKLFLT